MASLLDSAFNFISKQENCMCMNDYNKVTNTFTAYPDGKRHSIAFGSLAQSPYEVISYAQAVQRSKEYIKYEIMDFEQYGWFNALDERQKIAVLSYAYQYGNSGFLNSYFYTLIKNGNSKNDMLEWARVAPYSKRRIDEVNEYWSETRSNYIIWIVLLGIVLLRKCC